MGQLLRLHRLRRLLSKQQPVSGCLPQAELRFWCFLVVLEPDAPLQPALSS